MSPSKKVDVIIGAVCREWGIPVEKIYNPGYHEPRNAAICIIRKETSFTYAWIGERLKKSQYTVNDAANSAECRLCLNSRVNKILAILPQLYKQTK